MDSPRRQLRPGDMLVNNAFGFGMSEWRSALVLCIDQGQLPTKRELNDGRPASVLLLVTGPGGENIKQVSFNWLRTNQWENIDGFPDA